MTDPLWTFSNIAKATEGTCANDGEAYGVSIDSRTIRSGDVFLAFKGEYQDGHAYAGQAVAKGAAGVIISDGSVASPDVVNVWTRSASM